jgi:lysophospholipase L1-like esterase
MNMLRILLLLVLFPTSLFAQEDFLLRDGQRIVFLGDSNTFAGKFIAYLDGYLFTRFPNQKFDLINLGLPSETVTGLSEPDHPYPRPNLHDRLDKALEKSKPNVVVICYGMNDGIYYPYSDDRFKKYQEGILKVIEKVKKANALPILMTPAPFDPKPLKDKVLDKTAEKYSWMRPFEKYDEEVLSFYSEWLLSLKEEKHLVADPHTAIMTHLANMRKQDANYRVSGDGIHPNANGHALIFRELLLTLKAPPIVDQARFGGEVKDEKISEFSDKDGIISFKWTTRIPMPHDPQWSKKLALDERITEKLNWHAIRGQFVMAKKYTFFVNDQKIADITGEELTSGLNLLQFPDLITNKRATEMWKLVEERQMMLGRAWLTDVGHKRPDTPKGIPLEEAKKKAAEMETKIRKFAEPVELKIKFVSVEN